MTLTLTFDHPEFPDGHEFDVGGILVENREEVEITEDQERMFVARRRQSVREAADGNQFMKVTGKTTVSTKDMNEILVETNTGPTDGEVEETDEPATEEVEEGDV